MFSKSRNVIEVTKLLCSELVRLCSYFPSIELEKSVFQYQKDMCLSVYEKFSHQDVIQQKIYEN